MANEFSVYSPMDMKPDSSGDNSFLGVQQNTALNLVPDNYVYNAINKRFINGQCVDRSGHFATQLLNLDTDTGVSDVDAQIYIDAVQATGVTLSVTYQQQITYFVLYLKDQGLWTKMYAIYPFIGGTAAAHAVNLKSPGTYNITWSGSVTHNSNGVTGDGATAYGNTAFNPSLISPSMNNSWSFSVYNRTASSSQATEMGCYDGANIIQICSANNTASGRPDVEGNVPGRHASAPSGGNQGHIMGVRSSTTNMSLYVNGVLLATSATTNVAPVPNAAIDVLDRGGDNGEKSSKNICFGHMGTSLTTGESLILYSAVQGLESALNRQIGTVSSLPAVVTPVPKPTLYGVFEYNTAYGTKGAIAFGGTRAYLILAGNNAQVLAYPAGVTVSAPVWAVQADTKMVVFLGEGQTPLIYTGQYDTGTVVYTDTGVTAYELSKPSIVPDTKAFVLADQTAKTGGFFPMPQGKFGMWFNNRLWVLLGDMCWISDINDVDNYDYLQVLPIERGSNDSAIALFPYNPSTVIAFKQRSVYAISSIDDSLQNIQNTQISPNVGCISPYSICPSGEDLYFFSGGSVFSVRQALESRLQADAIDLADPLKVVMSRIVQPLSQYAAAHVYNNRLFLSLPIDGAAENNAVIIYNFINKAWEGYDQPARSEFNVVKFFEMPFLGKSRLFGVSKAGYCFLYDYDEGDMTDKVSSGVYTAATSEFHSRGYNGTQSQWYGQTYGAGPLSKFAVSGSFNMASLNPNFTVDLIVDGVNEYNTYQSSITRSNLVYDIWRKTNFDPTNINNDFSDPHRLDYGVNLVQSGIYLQAGINLCFCQGFSIPYSLNGSGNYFALRIRNTGGYTIITNVEISANTKENSYSKS